MPIDPNSMLLRLSPLAPINLGGLGGGSMERQRLELMRQQFEEQKRVNREQSELRRLGEANEMARANLVADNQRRQQEAAAAAKTQEQRLAAYQKFTELNGQGDIEGARAMVPLMTSLGMGVDLEGEEGGLPRYRIEMDAAAAEKAAQAGAGAPDNPYATGMEDLGYPADDAGGMTAPEGIGSTEEAFRRAQGASAFAAETGMPARAPDSPDFTGGVPKNVIDLGAMQASTLQRLAPALGSLVQAYPEQYRESAMQTAQGVAGMGLPGIKALEQFKSLRSSPDSLITSQNEAAAQQGRFEQTQQTAKDARKGTNFDIGYNTLGESIGKNYGVPQMREQMASIDRGLSFITNDSYSDDGWVLEFIHRSTVGAKGVATDKDIYRVTGDETRPWLEKVKNWLHTGLVGGAKMDLKPEIVAVLQAMKETERKDAFEFMDKIEEQAPDLDPDKAEGLRSYAKFNVPKSLRDEYQEKRKAAAKEKSSQFDAELDATSRASGLDPAKVRGVIRPESGGDPAAVNPQSGASGLIQFLPKVAESLGSSIEEIRKMTAEQQLPLVMKYLSERGITKDSPPGDYYMAVAAPAFIGKPDSSVVYKKGSKEWEQNPAWRPADGGDITVASIKAYGGGKKTEPKPADTADAKALKILEGAGYR